MSTLGKLIKWTTYEGVTKPLNDLEDLHISNIIIHVEKHKETYDKRITLACKEILTERGIDHKITLLGQAPHKNLNGKWAYWDSNSNEEIILQK